MVSWLNIIYYTINRYVKAPVHSAAHDSALAQLLALKQQHRKKGILEAKRQELILRSRAIDILDVRSLRMHSR